MPHDARRAPDLRQYREQLRKGILELDDIREAKEDIACGLALGEEDLVAAGTSCGGNCPVCGAEWRGPRQVLMRGPSWANRALIRALKEYRLETFAAVVVVSGDGVFADAVEMVRSRGGCFVVLVGKGL